jgi:hypothetical protein
LNKANSCCIGTFLNRLGSKSFWRKRTGLDLFKVIPEFGVKHAVIEHTRFRQSSNKLIFKNTMDIALIRRLM